MNREHRTRARAVFARHRFVAFAASTAVALAAGSVSCSSLPKHEHKKYPFPKEVFIGDVERPYQKLGEVRAKESFPTLDPVQEEGWLCKNYFNKAAENLLKLAKKNGGDAVIDVKSVVLLFDGKVEQYPQAECSDDGSEGQVAVRGVAIRWIKTDAEKRAEAEAAAAAALVKPRRRR